MQLLKCQNPITNSVFLYPQMAPLRYAHVIFAFLAANYIMVRISYMNKNLTLYKDVHENNTRHGLLIWSFQTTVRAVRISLATRAVRYRFDYRC